MNWGEMYPKGLDTKTADQLMQPKSFSPADAGIWDNFGPGAGSYLMRSFAEVGRGASMLAIGAASLTPSGIALKAIRPDLAQAKQDEAFRLHDEVFQSAVDYWTPKPNTVGKAGEIVGQLAGGVLQFMASPALAVATQQMSTSTDLVREGVDPGAALIAGDIAGIGAAVGVALPFLGSTFARKAASGAAGNLVQGVATAGATNALLQAAGRPDQAAKFDPFDLTARSLDVLLGVAFGGIAHVQSRGVKIPELDSDQKAALLTLNQSRHLEQSAAGDMTAPELTTHVTQVQQAVEQLLRGERVTVSDAPARVPEGQAEVSAEIQRLAAETGPTPDVIQRPPMATPEQAMNTAPVKDGAEVDPRITEGKRAMAQYPDMLIDTGNMMPDGTPERVPAADYVAKAEAELAQAKGTDSNLFRVAAECLLGAL